MTLLGNGAVRVVVDAPKRAGPRRFAIVNHALQLGLARHDVHRYLLVAQLGMLRSVGCLRDCGCCWRREQPCACRKVGHHRRLDLAIAHYAAHPPTRNATCWR